MHFVRVPARTLAALVVVVLVLAPGPPALAEPIPVAGRVTADGEPAKGALAALIPGVAGYAAGELRFAGAADPEPAATARADADGRFELEAPDVGFWKVRLDLDGRVPREVVLEPLVYATELGDVELERDVGLEMRLGAGDRKAAARVAAYPIDPATSRLAGRRVPAFEPGGWRRPLVVVQTDEEGVVGWPATGVEKAWVVEVAAEGFVPLLHETSGAPSAVALSSGVRLEVETVDERGATVPGVLLYLEDGRVPFARTGEQGRAALAAPAGGELELTAVGPEGRRGALRLRPPADGADGAAANLVLEMPRTVAGRVVEETTREPVPGALVWAGSVSDAVRTDSRGHYTVRLPADEAAGPRVAQIRAAAAGYVAGQGGAPRSGDAGPTIGLTPAAGLEGRVVDAGGAGLAGVEIEVSTRERGMSRRFVRGRLERHRARSGQGGRFIVPGLASGESYELRLARSGFRPGRLEVEELEPFERRAGLEVVLLEGRRAVGRVVDEEDRPVAGAEVRLEASADPGRRDFRRRIRMPGMEEDVPTGTTGAEGRFAVSDLAPGRYDLAVEAVGFGPVTVPGVEVPEGSGEVDLGTIALPPGVAIEGRVVDADGRPLGGIEVRATEPQGRSLPAALLLMMMAREPAAAVSGVDGHFTVADRRPGERLDLIVAGEGYVARSVPGVVAPPEEPLEVVLQQAARVLGRVVDDRGEPVAGAAVQARPEGLAGSGGRRMSGLNRAQTDAEGRFELAGVEPGNLTVEARAEGFQETQLSGLEAPAAGELAGVEMVLRPGAVVRGTVLDAGGEPVAGVQVTIAATGGRGRPEGFGITDGDGRFELSGVAPGRRTVTASEEGGRQAAKSVTVEAGSETIELRFAGGVEVSGRVLDAAGLGLAGAAVSLEPDVGRDRRWVEQPETTSADDGSFVLSGVAPGLYRMVATREGFAYRRLEPPIEVGESALTDLEIALDEGVTLRGRILGLGVDDLARVEVYAGGNPGRVDFEGNYTIPHLWQGENPVAATVPGTGRQARGRIRIEEGQREATLDLEFGTGYVLTGTVVFGEEPVAGVSVGLAGLSVFSFGGATTDSAGRFRVEGLAEGSYLVRVWGDESGLHHTEELDLHGDDDLVVQIGTGRLAGRVLERDGASGVEGVRLELTAVDATGWTSRRAASDFRGHFSFGAVSEGTYKLSASKPGYADVEMAVTVGPGQAVEGLEVFLTATSGLAFTVESAAGAPPARVLVALLDGGGERVAGGSFLTLDGGRVELTTAPAGVWELLVAAGDSATARMQVTVPGEGGRVWLGPGGGVDVRVPDLADGSARAELELIGPNGRPHRGFEWDGSVVARKVLRDGRAVVDNLASGTWTVRVTAADGRAWSAPAVVTPGARVPVELR